MTHKDIQVDMIELFIKIDDREFEKACAAIKQREEKQRIEMLDRLKN